MRVPTLCLHSISLRRYVINTDIFMIEAGTSEFVDRQVHQERSDEPTFTVRYLDVDDLLADYHAELSAGRIFIPTLHQHSAGDPATISFHAPGLRDPLQARGAIESIVRKRDRRRRGINVAFTDESRKILEDHTQRIVAQDPEFVVQLVRVLVVDDNLHCAKLLQDGLRLAERRVFENRITFHVPTSATVGDALAFLRKKPIHALIVDMYLGGGNGVAIIEHVRGDEDQGKVPIIAISGSHDQSTRQAAVDAGADAFIEKPLRLKEVVSVLHGMLEI